MPNYNKLEIDEDGAAHCPNCDSVLQKYTPKECSADEQDDDFIARCAACGFTCAKGPFSTKVLKEFAKESSCPVVFDRDRNVN